MGWSQASQDGIAANGRAWREGIRGLPDVLDAVRQGVAAKDAEAIEAGLRGIFALFNPLMSQDDLSLSDKENLEWFESESPAYEIERGELAEWVHEFCHRLDALYDWADYNRVWVDPTVAAKGGV